MPQPERRQRLQSTLELGLRAKDATMHVPRTSIGSSVRHVDSSFRLLPYFQFELRRGPAPNIAHSFVAGCESPLAVVGVGMIPSALVERRATVQCELGGF